MPCAVFTLWPVLTRVRFSNHDRENLVFVPIMVGMIFFLIEFYGDKFLAFTVLSMVWICEVFSAIR